MGVQLPKIKITGWVMREKSLSFLALIFTLSFLPSIAFAFTMPDTGQTKCYDTAGTEIECSGTGQDGAYNINPMSYTDNGNGTITDNVTGLMWQKEDTSSGQNWYRAVNHCNSLNLGGLSDWRLPTKKELYTITYHGHTAINTPYFPNTRSYAYWSSTEWVVAPFQAAYMVYFPNGGIDNYCGMLGGSYVKEHCPAYARCVRGRQALVSFTDNGNGAVTDNGTGLMWQKEDDNTKRPWANALSYCEGLSLGGQTDWRLPNVKELESLTDDTKFDPAINTTYFPNTHKFYYWSSSTYAYSAATAFSVYFGDGIVDNSNKSDGKYVRCVRGGQSGSLCDLAISPSSQTFTITGGTPTVTVTAPLSACSWAATTTLDWVTITSDSSGTGSGTVTLSVAANTTGTSRTGNIDIAGQTFTITQSDTVFADVAASNGFYVYIKAIYDAGITRGCAQDPLRYCSDDVVHRGAMAAFLIRALYGENFTYTQTPYFSDVPVTHGFFKYVQKMKDTGLTAVTDVYNVNGIVTRGAMAAFIIRARYGENFTYTQTPYYSDVPATHGFFKYVQKMRDEGITLVTGSYDVDGYVTRGALAAFLIRSLLGAQYSCSTPGACLFYTDANTNGKNLYVVDPANIAVPRLIDTGISSANPIHTGTYDGSNQMLSGITERFIVYRKGGKIFKLDTLQSGNFTPVQVSNETGASDFTAFIDWADVNNSALIYNNRMVKLGMSSTEAPWNVTVGQGLRPFYDSSMFAIAGYIGLNSLKNLFKCDANLSNCLTISAVSSYGYIGDEYHVGVNSHIKVLNIDGNLWTYDLNTNGLVLLYTATKSITSFAADNSFAYFADGSKIIRMSYYDFSTVLLGDLGTGSIQDLRLSDNRVVFVIKYAADSFVLKALPKTGGNPINLSSSSITRIYIKGLSGNHIYYENSLRASHVMDDGSGLTEFASTTYTIFGTVATAGSRLVGNIFSTAYVESQNRSSGRIILQENGAVKSFDMATFSGEIVHGSLPQGNGVLRLYCGQFFGNQGLCKANTSTYQAQNDIFFIDVSAQNSLMQVTNTTVDEQIIR